MNKEPLTEYEAAWNTLEQNGKTLAKYIKNLKDMITKLEGQLEKHRWIPVSERLPEDNQCVLVTIKHINDTWGFLAWYQLSRKQWSFYDPMVRGMVTHWKPIILPE